MSISIILYLNRLNTIKIAKIAIPSANKKAVIMDIRILVAAEGFLDTAFTAAYPTNPITAAGPKVLKIIIRMMVILRMADIVTC
jgi:hypothetical protein